MSYITYPYLPPPPPPNIVTIKICKDKNNNKNIYPAMTAFTDQYSLPNIFFDIGQL
jgi:hypothetical protein